MGNGFPSSDIHLPTSDSRKPPVMRRVSHIAIFLPEITGRLYHERKNKQDISRFAYQSGVA